jgi:TRAP-type C4-dicarboxylate transport system substrate-binding protein
MNKDSFAKLPEKAQAAIDRFSGEPLTKTLGAAADSVDAADRAKNMAQSGHMEKKLTPDETNRLRTVFKPILDEWVAATPDGARVLAAYRAEIERIRRAP